MVWEVRGAVHITMHVVGLINFDMDSVGQTFACVSQFHLWFTAGVFLKVPTSSQLKCRRRGEASVLVPGSANSSFSSELLCS